MPNTEKRAGLGSTISSLAGETVLELALVIDGIGVNSEIRGHTTTDLARPARYLLPGDLVLTNGLWLEARPVGEWIQEVSSAGVAGLLFGLSEQVPALPASVGLACESYELPLLVAPQGISFSRVIEHMNVVQERLDPARQQLSRLRRVQQRLAGCTEQSELIDLIHNETRLRCWLVGPSGRVIASTGAAVDQETMRAAARATRAGKIFSSLEGDLCAFTVDPTRVHMGLTLVVASHFTDLDDETRLIIETILPSFFIEYVGQRARDGMRSILVRELLELVCSASIDQEPFVARMRGLDFDPNKPVTVIASDNNPDVLAYAAEGCEARCVYTRYGSVNMLIGQTEEPGLLDEIAQLIKDTGVDPVLGSGHPGLGRDGLRRSLAQALPALRVAQGRPCGSQVVCQTDIGSYVALLDFIDRRTLHSFRDTLLGPLLDWDRDHGSDLVTTLRTFLENGGRWRQTARELFVHHNTLKYRISRISTLTGQDLDTMSSRVDFTLAFAMPAEEQGLGPSLS
ncbi:helix-turn-helix domain-containing protein [Arthrobacter sp. MYb227]|uniref:helix-turn-helix domain-containing protein n=1 Tax=Arthrobacter sp. MYb227 TaxID=1848601 RepID=UPI0015E3D8B6|nr:helix-turn-helix domain-containing protein [Arthrobacter sp. MYb227]